MEFVKIIAPWLPFLAAAYILVECRYCILVLWHIVKRKIAGQQALALRQQPSSLEGSPPAPAGEVMNHPCQRLLSFPDLAIFSICLACDEEDELDDEKSSERFNNESVNEAFSKLLENL